MNTTSEPQPNTPAKLRYKFFTRKNGCPRCESAKTIITDLSMAGEKVEVYYMDEDLRTPLLLTYQKKNGQRWGK